MKARLRYNELQSERQQFLDVAHECSQLTLPYLIKGKTITRSTNHCVRLGKVSEQKQQ